LEPIIISFIAALALGLVIGFLFARFLASGASTEQRVELESQVARVGAELEGFKREAAEKDNVINELREKSADASSKNAEQRVELESQVARISAELVAAKHEAAEKIVVLQNAREQFTETFKALAADALHKNSESFVAHARTQMESLMTKADGNIGKHREEIGKLINPLGEVLKKYEEDLKKIEKERGESYVGLREQVTSMTEQHHRLQKETSNLTNALKLPQVRGRWGEMTLKRTAELAGMSEHCDFSEQVTIKESRQRPDMIVHLPGGREIVVDSKVSLSAYLEAIEAPDGPERDKFFVDHARQVRTHMQSLSSKEYGKQFEKAPDFTVLFLPGEPFFSAAVRNDLSLIEDGAKRNIIIATPTTLISLMWAVAHGWQQAQIEENARKIFDEGKELFNRSRIMLDHFADIGPALKKAVDKFNSASKSLDTRFMPSVRRLAELGAGDQNELPSLDAVESTPRELESGDA